MFDAALADTVSKFPVDIQPFKDMIEGMRLDLRKSRYKNFDELSLLLLCSRDWIFWSCTSYRWMFGRIALVITVGYFVKLWIFWIFCGIVDIQLWIFCGYYTILLY